jgi:hypothetical protein
MAKLHLIAESIGWLWLGWKTIRFVGWLKWIFWGEA